MPDYSFLMGAQPMQTPNPLDLAAKGMSLGEMSQKMQLGQLALQQAQGQSAFWQDPNNAGLLQQLLGTGGAGGPSPDAIASIQAKTGAGMPAVINQLIGMQKNTTDVAKMQSEAQKNQQEVLDKRMALIGHLADNAATTGNPQSYAQLSSNVVGWGLDKYLGAPPDPSQDPQGASTYVTAARGLLLDSSNRAALAKTIAEAGVAQQTVEQGPAKLQLAQQEGAIKAATAGMDLSKFMTGEPFQGADGKIYMKQPGTDASGNPTVNIVPAMYGGAGPPNVTPPGAPSAPGTPQSPANTPIQPSKWNLGETRTPGQILQAKYAQQQASGQIDPDLVAEMKARGVTPSGPPPPNAPTPQVVNPTDVGMSKGAGELLAVDAKTAGDLAAKIPSGYAALENLNNMEKTAASGAGIYSGPIKGSEFFQNVAGVLSQLPGAPDDMAKKVSNTQAWKQQGGEFLLDTMGEMKGFVPRSAAAMNAIRAIKPNEIMTPEAQQMVIGFLRDAINTQINYAKSASAQVGANKTIAGTPVPTSTSASAKFSTNPDGSWNMDLR